MHKYKDLILWNKAIVLVTEIYGITSKFPEMERFNLISQINRAAVSIPSNIAEGAGRNSKREFLQFLSIAHASTYEVETQLIIAKNLGYLTLENLDAILNNLYEIQKMSYSFQKSIQQSLILNTNTKG